MGYGYIMLFWDILGLMCWGCLKTSHQRVMHSEVRFCLRWGFDYIQQWVSANRVPIYHVLTVAHMDLCAGSFADWNSRQEVECQTVTKDAWIGNCCVSTSGATSNSHSTRCESQSWAPGAWVLWHWQRVCAPAGALLVQPEPQARYFPRLLSASPATELRGTPNDATPIPILLWEHPTSIKFYQKKDARISQAAWYFRTEPAWHFKKPC